MSKPNALWTIYALCEPDSTIVRYIGKTSQTVEQRISGRMGAARVNTHVHAHRYEWLRSLGGARPAYIVLEMCDGDEVNEREKQWIAFGRTLWDLTNGTAGGDGGDVHALMSPESRHLASIRKSASQVIRAQRDREAGAYDRLMRCKKCGEEMPKKMLGSHSKYAHTDPAVLRMSSQQQASKIRGRRVIAGVSHNPDGSVVVRGRIPKHESL